MVKMKKKYDDDDNEEDDDAEEDKVGEYKMMMMDMWLINYLSKSLFL